MELHQGVDIIGESAEERLFTELRAITGLVRCHSSEELRQEYLRKGNIHRDWNLAGISRTERRRFTFNVSGNVNGAPVEVELAHWWRPQTVALARMSSDGHPVLAVSIGITHVGLLTLLKTMVALQQDQGALAEHQQGYEETRRSRTGG